jgi:hypothetical protein
MGIKNFFSLFIHEGNILKKYKDFYEESLLRETGFQIGAI